MEKKNLSPHLKKQLNAIKKSKEVVNKLLENQLDGVEIKEIRIRNHSGVPLYLIEPLKSLEYHLNSELIFKLNVIKGIENRTLPPIKKSAFHVSEILQKELDAGFTHLKLHQEIITYREFSNNINNSLYTTMREHVLYKSREWIKEFNDKVKGNTIPGRIVFHDYLESEISTINREDYSLQYVDEKEIINKFQRKGVLTIRPLTFKTLSKNGLKIIRLSYYDHNETNDDIYIKPDQPEPRNKEFISSFEIINNNIFEKYKDQKEDKINKIKKSVDILDQVIFQMESGNVWYVRDEFFHLIMNFIQTGIIDPVKIKPNNSDLNEVIFIKPSAIIDISETVNSNLNIDFKNRKELIHVEPTGINIEKTSPPKLNLTIPISSKIDQVTPSQVTPSSGNSKFKDIFEVFLTLSIGGYVAYTVLILVIGFLSVVSGLIVIIIPIAIIALIYDLYKK